MDFNGLFRVVAGCDGDDVHIGAIFFFQCKRRDVVFDQDKMKQVILNLVYTAVQYTNEKTSAITICLQRGSDGVMLMIADNGTGIAPEHLPHLFDRFYRADSSRSRKYGGSGLGLAITKSIIDSHNGTIEVKSEISRDTVFLIRLPAPDYSLDE